MIQTQIEHLVAVALYILSRNPVFALEMIQTKEGGGHSDVPNRRRNPVFALEMIQTY